MLTKFLMQLLDLKKPEMITIKEKIYVANGYKPALVEYPGTINTSTLTSIVDFHNEDIDKWKDKKCFISVNGPSDVYFQSEMLGDFNQRVGLIKANAIISDFEYGRQYELEEFIIALNSQFEETEDKTYLLNLVSNLAVDSSVKNTDNGMSQAVAVKNGITLKDEIEIKNPLTLKPFRTFTEIDQPESEFLVRINSQRGFKVSLHSCDGAKWKMQAIKDIKAFFTDKLSDMAVIA